MHFYSHMSSQKILIRAVSILHKIHTVYPCPLKTKIRWCAHILTSLFMVQYIWSMQQVHHIKFKHTSKKQLSHAQTIREEFSQDSQFSSRLPWIWTPMHGIDLGKVAPECPPSAHLYPPNGFHVACCLHQACVTCCFPCILQKDTHIHTQSN
jgi:hypothetical protein